MARASGGFARTKWCGSLECELAMKEKAGRVLPLHAAEAVRHRAANAWSAARNAPPTSTGAWRIKRKEREVTRSVTSLFIRM